MDFWIENKKLRLIQPVCFSFLLYLFKIGGQHEHYKPEVSDSNQTNNKSQIQKNIIQEQQNLNTKIAINHKKSTANNNKQVSASSALSREDTKLQTSSSSTSSSPDTTVSVGSPVPASRFVLISNFYSFINEIW